MFGAVQLDFTSNVAVARENNSYSLREIEQSRIKFLLSRSQLDAKVMKYRGEHSRGRMNEKKGGKCSN